jgi:GT2 family glycosyltransferase
MVDVLKIIYGKIKKTSKDKVAEGIPELLYHENVMIHGCCVVFSPLYVARFDGLDDRTFLYREEQLLYIRLLKNNLLSIYDPEIFIIHLEDAATNEITKSKKEKRIFTLQNEVKSMKILIQELKEINR